MLCQSWIGPPASHYYTSHRASQRCPPAIKSLWHVFQFLRHLPPSFLLVHHYSISLACVFLTVLPLFPSFFPSAGTRAHPHAGHSSSSFRAISLLTRAALRAQNMRYPRGIYFWGARNFTNILINQQQPEEGRATNHIVQVGWERQSKEVKWFFSRQQQQCDHILS